MPQLIHQEYTRDLDLFQKRFDSWFDHSGSNGPVVAPTMNCWTMGSEELRTSEGRALAQAPVQFGHGTDAALCHAYSREVRAAVGAHSGLPFGAANDVPSAFAAARSMYRSAGFEPCEPYGAYTENPHSVCMSMEL